MSRAGAHSPTGSLPKLPPPGRGRDGVGVIVPVDVAEIHARLEKILAAQERILRQGEALRADFQRVLQAAPVLEAFKKGTDAEREFKADRQGRAGRGSAYRKRRVHRIAGGAGRI